MRKLGLLTFLVLQGGRALASDCSYQVDAEPIPDMFSRLEERYAAGTAVCDRALDGWQSLRCFSHWNKNIVGGGMLAFENGATPSTDLCNQPNGFKFQKVSVNVALYSDSPNYFDYIDSPVKSWIDSFLDERWYRYTPAQFDGDALVTYPDWVNVSYHLKESDGTLILKTVDEGDYGTPGQTLDMCYAVAPVRQNADAGQPAPGAADAAMDWAKIDALYAAGVLPTRETIEGWWAGRCFLAEDPTRAVASLLGAEDTGLHGDYGPMGEKAFKLNHILTSTSVTPTFFDQLQNYRLEVARRALSSHADIAGVAAAIDGALVSREIGQIECIDYELRARIAGDYVVAKMVLPAAGADAEKVIGECYYFARTPVPAAQGGQSGGSAGKP